MLLLLPRFLRMVRIAQENPVCLFSSGMNAVRARGKKQISRNMVHSQKRWETRRTER